MGWFGGKSIHKKQVAAAMRIALNLYEETTIDPRLGTQHHQGIGSGLAPTVLNFQLPDSRFRYMMFCLSTVFVESAHRMNDGEAILDMCAQALITTALDPKAAEQLLGQGPHDRQRVMADGSTYLRELFAVWSDYKETRKRGNTQGATSLMVALLYTTESLAQATEDQRPRLGPLARWIQEWMSTSDNAFVQLSR